MNAPPAAAQAEMPGIMTSPAGTPTPPAGKPSRAAHGPASAMRAQIAPDTATCRACTEEVLNPFERRYRYPFISCGHCGPRFSILTGAPGDGPLAAMSPPCEACRAERDDPASRRFQDGAVVCHGCGPRARLIRFDGAAISFDQFSMLDDVDAAGSLIRKGEIVAIKDTGGYRLACDAANAGAVARLRAGKRSAARPFALMARDLDVIRNYCTVTPEEEGLLRSPAAPIVVLAADGPKRLPDDIAPGLDTLGFMLPATAMHLLMLRRMDRPVVVTSGNVSGEPPITDDEEARSRLLAITPFALVHDRAAANRLDDSVACVVGGRSRLIRRSRGHAPAPIPLPLGFQAAPDLLAMGGDNDAGACLVRQSEAVLTQACGDLTQPAGDLANARNGAEYRRVLKLFGDLLGHHPAVLIADLDPDCRSTRLAQDLARDQRLPIMQVQRYHAHVAACLVENGYPLDAPPVLGIALGALGLGDDGTMWGGEFLLADYRGYQRLGTVKPVAMPGGGDAIRQPWRSLYAHLTAELGWAEFAMNFSETELFAFLDDRRRPSLDAMIKGRRSAPLASSCAGLIDAVAAALGICREQQSYAGETAARLEAIADHGLLQGEDEEYPVAIPVLPGSHLPYIEPVWLWRAILGDIWLKTPAAAISARFHRWLINSVMAMTVKLARRSSPEGPRFDTVALSGECFHNRILLTELTRRLEAANFTVLSHALVPPGDGCLALGQAAIGAARLIAKQRKPQGNASCVSEFPAAS